MAQESFDNSNENIFWENVEAQFEEKAPDFSKTLNIAVIGKVSSGKSSLINALLKRRREKALAEVGAISGVTTALKVLKLDERVRLIDSPGLDDVRAENSELTKNFLKHIDVGILVISGSSDASQKKHLDDLKVHCRSIFVVLNKIDEHDKSKYQDGSNPALDKVISQWKRDLNINKIYPVCTFGYDKDLPPEKTLDIRGVCWLREDIEKFLKSEGKDLLLARHMGEKKPYAIGIIATALAAVTAEAFIPGSAAYITATQTAAIGSLYYLYTGEVLSLKAALAVLPVFIAESAGTNLFLWATSILPPTGVINLVAAGIAVGITLSILGAVNFVLESGAKLDEKNLLKSKFTAYQKQTAITVRQLANMDIKNLSAVGGIIGKFL